MKPIKDLRRNNFVHLMAEQGGQSAIAARIKRDRNQVYQWTLDPSNPASRGIGDKLARVIEKALHLPAGWLDVEHPAQGNGGVSSHEEMASQIPPTAFRRVPVVGTASLGLDGYWTDLEYPAGHGDGYFEFTTKDRDAYSLQVKGNSMFPAIRSGWYVIIEPSKALQPGEFVLVKLKDGRSTVKEFLWQRDGEYVLNAVSDGARIVIPESDVELIHHVGGILPPSGRMV